MKNFKKIINLLFILLSITTMFGCTNSNSSNATDDNNANYALSHNKNESVDVKVLKDRSLQIGQEIKQSDIISIVNSVRIETSNDYKNPKNGNKYIFINVSITNNSTDSLTISSILNFDLFDTKGKSCEMGIVPNNAAVDRDIAPGDTMTGEIVYQISSKATEAYIGISTNLDNPYDFVHLTF